MAQGSLPGGQLFLDFGQGSRQTVLLIGKRRIPWLQQCVKSRERFEIGTMPGFEFCCVLISLDYFFLVLL